MYACSHGAEIELEVAPTAFFLVTTTSSAYAASTPVPAGANSCRGTAKNAAATSGRVRRPLAVN